MEVIIIIDNLYGMDNGVSASVIRKIKFIEDTWNFKTTLFIPAYNVELNYIKQNLEYGNRKSEQVLFNKGAKIINLFEYLQKTPQYDEETETIEYKFDESGGIEYRNIGNNIFEVYDGPYMIRREYYTGLGSCLRKIERLDGNGIIT
jgi:hypothetical protein